MQPLCSSKLVHYLRSFPQVSEEGLLVSYDTRAIVCTLPPSYGDGAEHYEASWEHVRPLFHCQTVATCTTAK